MEIIRTRRLPSLIFNNPSSAEAEAVRFGVEVCKIFFMEGIIDGELVETHLGYGLLENGRLLETSDFEWETLKAAFTTRDGRTVERTLKVTDTTEKDGIKSLSFDDIDNGAPGTYKVTIYGEGEYIGSITYTYKVTVK